MYLFCAIINVYSSDHICSDDNGYLEFESRLNKMYIHVYTSGTIYYGFEI